MSVLYQVARHWLASAGIVGMLAALPCANAQELAAEQPPVSDDLLGSVSGKADIRQDVRSGLSGSVQGNSIAGDATGGPITLGNAALQGTNGLFIVSANTGNNVAINAALSVNVTIVP